MYFVICALRNVTILSIIASFSISVSVTVGIRVYFIVNKYDFFAISNSTCLYLYTWKCDTFHSPDGMGTFSPFEKDVSRANNPERVVNFVPRRMYVNNVFCISWMLSWISTNCSVLIQLAQSLNNLIIEISPLEQLYLPSSCSYIMLRFLKTL